ncbi:MAG: hypothetical protein LBS06_07705 [Treponema sp.]|jgi:hypothetical protein|nr:hypothetical protein [Treponema sp.]
MKKTGFPAAILAALRTGGFSAPLRKKIRLPAVIPVLCLATLGSCIGVRADISLRGDGSGRLNLEYRIGRALDSLGKLDGNERWPTVPAGKADFERSLQRLPGLRLLSFSTREEGKAILNRVALEFDDLEALCRFLDASGGGAVLSREGAAVSLALILNRGTEDPDPDLAALIRNICEGYRVEMSLSVPGEAELAFTDGRGGRADPPAGAVLRGKTVSFGTGTGNVLGAGEGFGLTFRFPSF